MPKLDLAAFFAGETEGRGRIDLIFQSSKPLRVRSDGRPDGRGGLVLAQAIREGSKPARTRLWRMHCTKQGRCDGTLTDAAGPVTVAVDGNTAHIRYRMKGGLAVEQWLVLQSDRRTLANSLRVSKWGVTVARVDETIRKAP